MALFGHHADAFLQIEIMGRPFPSVPMEHGLAFGVTGIVFLLILYGAYAGVRDLRRWLGRSAKA